MQGADFALENSLFGAIKLTKNTAPNKCSYPGYSVVFDARENVLLSHNSGIGKNVIIFGVDMSLSVYVENKKKDLLILGKGPTDWLDDTMLITDIEYCISFR